MTLATHSPTSMPLPQLPPQSAPPPRFRILTPTPVLPPKDNPEGRERQDCSRCRNVDNCWSPKAKENNIILNLLVCRIQRDIERERSSRLLLRLLRPKLRKLANSVQGSQIEAGLIDADELVVEMEGVIIETLLESYVMGGLAYPLHYLFSQPNGRVWRWLLDRVNTARRFYKTHWFYGGASDYDERRVEGPRTARVSPTFEDRVSRLNYLSSGGRVSHHPLADNAHYPRSRPDKFQEKVNAGLDAVDDGVTLSLSEFRVMRFCLTNARDDGARMTSGLHLYLASVLEEDRDILSRTYRVAERRLVDAVGLTGHKLKQRGVDLKKVPRGRRKRTRRASRMTSGARLTVQEIIDAVAFVEAHPEASFEDLAWAYGISRVTLSTFYRRFRGKSTSEIRVALKDRLAREAQEGSIGR